MDAEAQPKTSPPSNPDSALINFLAARSLPCPRCAYDLRDIQSPKCPECGEPLFLTVCSAKPRFGYLILAMAPGCFSGVAACFVAIPVSYHAWVGTINRPRGMPLPIVAADLFGFLSAASVVLMYKHRHTIMAWTERRQRNFAITIWIIHILMFALLVTWMALTQQ